MKPWELADLTPRQIDDLYCHPRDDQGRVKFPIAVDPGPVDARANILRVLALAPLMGVAPAQVEELQRRLAELDGVPYAAPARGAPDNGDLPFPVQFNPPAGAHDDE